MFAAGSLPNYVITTTPIEADTWYHVALIYDGASTLQQIYINGTLDAEGPTADDPWGGGASPFGHRAGQNQQYYHGILDDVRCYDEVLDAEANAELMKGEPELAGDPSSADGAVDVAPEALLSWRAGLFRSGVRAQRHQPGQHPNDVYWRW
ncbi:MAG: LamG domain-containing protein [Phycisphaerales bacterium]|nr:MAG: LamG domain-containing protein [Phycisphaerales bacterium]